MKQLTQFEHAFKHPLTRIGFGGIPIQRLSMAQSDTVISHAIASGINFFDTARGYTDSEEKFGRIISKHRSKIFLATKSMARTYETMKHDIVTSLNTIGTDWIDLYQCHAVGSETDLTMILDPQQGALRALQEAQSHSKIRFIGITGHISSVVVKALKTGYFHSAQIPHNALEIECEKELVPLCKELSIPLIAMKPIGGGAFQNIARISITYPLTHGSSIAIPGMDAPEQIAQNLSALSSLSSLSMEDQHLLDKEKKVWQGEFCRRCEYCMPCPQGLKIPLLLLLKAYWDRYNLYSWVKSRLKPLDKKYRDCTQCGTCQTKCPYQLPIAAMMQKGKEFTEST